MLVLKSVNFDQRQFQLHRLEQSRPDQTEWVIGRNRSCDLILPSPEISRLHARVVYDDETYYFVDVGSKSGSLLNGDAIPANDRRPLRPGDLLQLGETFLYVEELNAIAESEAIALSKKAISAGLELDRPWTEAELVCRCCRIVDETPDVKTFFFVAEPRRLFHYQPGQFVNVQVEIDGKSVVRPYSISSSPTRPHHLSITVKRVVAPAENPDLPNGLVSNWLHDRLQVGDFVKLIGGPMGQFTCLPDLPRKVLLLSAGSGITPMMSMTRWVQDTLAECDVVFVYSARTSEDIVFRAELEAIAAHMPNFHLAVTTTQQPARKPWVGLTGRISEPMVRLLVPDLLERKALVCGPDQFMQEMRSLLEKLQFPMQNYLEESFGGRSARPFPSTGKETALQLNFPVHEAPNPLSPGQNDPAILEAPTFGQVTIHFTHSNQAIPTDGTASILEVAEQEGIQIRHACRMGACGACKVRVQQGKVRYETPPSALSHVDQAAGYALACVGYPVEQVAIEA